MASNSKYDKNALMEKDRKSVLQYRLQYTSTDAMQICGKFWDTQYDVSKSKNEHIIYFRIMKR